jgi:hypothetical protein
VVRRCTSRYEFGRRGSESDGLRRVELSEQRRDDKIIRQEVYDCYEPFGDVP